MLKTSILHLAKGLGLFRLSRRLTRGKLRILCYHGIAIEDEDRFRPGLFMRAETFDERMRCISEGGYRVLTLADAIEGLRLDALPDDAVVITIDDGWCGTALFMAPVLSKWNFPATLYVSTYYLSKQTRVFNVAVAYVFWKSERERLDLSEIGSELNGTYELRDYARRREVVTRVVEHGEALPDAEAREALLRRLCVALGVSYSRLASSRMLTYMTPAEAERLPELGMDLQLHTHRHDLRFTDYERIGREIEDNRRVLRSVGQGSAVHFCYPSGYYDPEQFVHLRALGIASATTVEPGLADAGTNVLALPRILDSEQLSRIEFEAELSGFAELARNARGRLRRALAGSGGSGREAAPRG